MGIDWLQCGLCTSGNEFLILLILSNLNFNSHMWLVATVLNSAGVEILKESYPFFILC